MRIVRVAGIVFTGLLIAYLPYCKRSPKKSKKQEGINAPAEQTCIEIRRSSCTANNSSCMNNLTWGG